MAFCIDFHGSNINLGRPVDANGVEDDRVEPISAFSNDVCIVTCWQLTQEDIHAINASDGKIFISLQCYDSFPPMFVGSESAVKGVVQDYGATWVSEREIDAQD